MVARSSPKALGLDSGFSTVFGQSIDWNSGLFDSPKIEILGLFSDSPELNCETESQIVKTYSSVCIAKMNNMIVV